MSAIVLLCVLGLSARGAAAQSEPVFDGIDHVTINVPDLAKSEDWYTRTLGFTVAHRTSEYVILGARQATLVLNRATTAPAAQDPATAPGIFHIAFNVKPGDLPAAVAAFRLAGTIVDIATDGEHENAYFQDPDGNILEFIAHAPLVGTNPGEELTWLGDVLLDHLEAISPYVRLRRNLPMDRLPDMTPAGAKAEAAFNRLLLARLERLEFGSLSHEQQLLAGILRQQFVTGASADEDYWFQFAVTPYAGGSALQDIHQEIEAAAVASAAERKQYLHIVDDYAAMLKAMAEKTRAQATRGILIPKPALPGVRAMLKGFRESVQGIFEDPRPSASSVGNEDTADFIQEVHERVISRVFAAYDDLIGLFDVNYENEAPNAVGMSQYPGGRAYYRRRIRAETSLELRPEAIHALGLRRVAELDAQMANLRKSLGFKGDRAAFHAMLRSNQRFLAVSPAEVEARYNAAILRVAPKLPEYFLVLPKAPYGVKRLDPAAEPGMTYGNYIPPSPAESRGLYRYNGSNLSQRSLVTSAHLIYHELVPGHHLRGSLGAENQSLHPVLEFLSNSAFEEGWAEYAANLAGEMGALDDPYDCYGHLLSQAFLAARLVVDTGMNSLGWTRERAQRFMHEHTFESDTQLATETLRYSTDIPAQALAYRLGYEAFMDGRHRAEKALGRRFDLRAFDTAVSNHGAMPLNVLNQQIDWFIAASAHVTE